MVEHHDDAHASRGHHRASQHGNQDITSHPQRPELEHAAQCFTAGILACRPISLHGMSVTVGQDQANTVRSPRRQPQLASAAK